MVDLIKGNHFLKDRKRRANLEIPGFSELGKSVLEKICTARRSSVLQLEFSSEDKILH